MSHGLSESVGGVHYKHDPNISDEQLYRWGYNRVYDTVEMEANLQRGQDLIDQRARRMGLVEAGLLAGRSTGRSAAGCSSRSRCPASSAAPIERGVPVYVPAMTDSELGLSVAKHALARSAPGKEPNLDAFFAAVPSYNPFLDLHDYTRRIVGAKRLGMFTVGGGVPRNWAQQVGPFVEITQHAAGHESARPAIPIRRSPLSRTGPLGRTERLHLYRRRFVGKVRQPRGRRTLRRSALRRHDRLAAVDTGLA